MTTSSTEFITGSQVDGAWRQVRDAPGALRLERRVGDSGWRPVGGVKSITAVRRYVRGLDRAPVPGSFRLVKDPPESANLP